MVLPERPPHHYRGGALHRDMGPISRGGRKVEVGLNNVANDSIDHAYRVKFQ